MRLRFVIAAAFTAACAVLFSNCAAPGPCQFNSQCAVGYYCSATKSTCVRNCQDASRDCAPGEICDVNGQCHAPTADGGVPDVVTQDTSTNDVVTQDTTTQDTSTDVVQQGAKLELDLCSSDSECKNGICRALYKGGPSRCTPTCTQSSQCRAGARCLTIGADTYCADADVGKTCSGSSACNYACVQPPGSYCTTPCTSGSDCPNGYGCGTISNQKVCVRAEEYCGQTNNCTYGTSYCDATQVASGCTLPCTSAADCPQRASVLPQWTCDGGGVCRRPSDVFGPLAQGEGASYACNSSAQEVNLCNDAQHIDFGQGTIPTPPTVNCGASTSVDGVAGDVCVDSCRYSGACAFGYECTGIGDVTNTRIGLCMPSHGNGEVGSACSTDGDCAFGYCSSSKCSRDCSADGVCPTGSTCTAVGGQYPNVEGIAFKRCQ